MSLVWNGILYEKVTNENEITESTWLFVRDLNGLIDDGLSRHSEKVGKPMSYSRVENWTLYKPYVPRSVLPFLAAAVGLTVLVGKLKKTQTIRKTTQKAAQSKYTQTPQKATV